MDDYAASCSQIENLVEAAHCIKETLICSICLELFDEPVIIKCGHKFCRTCILRVTTNDNSTCPFCNIKIKKRSIPKEVNVFLQSCVKSFKTLVDAIKSDSGINVLESRNKVKHTKESVLLHESSNINKAKAVSISSKQSSSVANQTAIKSKTNSNNNKKFVPKKARGNIKSSQNSNTLHKYLSNKTDCSPNAHDEYTNEKVKSWLSGLTEADNEVSTSSKQENTSPLYRPDNKDEELLFSEPKESCNKSLSKTLLGTSSKLSTKSNISDHSSNISDETKFKEMKVSKSKKRINLSLTDKTTLKTPSSVPVTLHSDANDWGRVKRVGKEMQVKTFKSLNVSVEKGSSSVVLDDTVPMHSINNDSKNTVKELDSIDSSEIILPLEQKVLTKQLEKPKDIKEYNVKNRSYESSNSQIEDVSFSGINQKQMNDIIGFKDHLSTPEKTRNVNILNQEYNPKLDNAKLSPLKENNNLYNEEAETTNNEQIYIDNSHVHNCLLKPKLSSKLKYTPNESKPISSKASTPSEVSKSLVNNFTPERPKSRLSLRLPSTKLSSNNLNQVTATPKELNQCTSNSNRRIITFTKLGKICKRRKNVPFLLLGKTNKTIYKRCQTTGLLVKSSIPVNIDYKTLLLPDKVTNDKVSLMNESKDKEVKMVSPEDDSQLKYLNIDTPYQFDDENARNEDETEFTNFQQKEMNEEIKIDIIIPELHEKLIEKVNIKIDDKNNKVIDNNTEKKVSDVYQSTPVETMQINSIEIDIKNSENYNRSINSSIKEKKHLDMPNIFQSESPINVDCWKSDDDFGNTENNKSLQHGIDNLNCNKSINHSPLLKQNLDTLNVCLSESSIDADCWKRDDDFEISENNKNQNLQYEANIEDCNKSTKKYLDMPNVFQSGSSTDADCWKRSDDFEIPENNENHNIHSNVNKIQEDIISINSNETEPKKLNNKRALRISTSESSSVNTKVKSKHSDIESDVEFSEKSDCTSTTSSLKTSSKKKRTLSDSSDEVTTSIIDKWCDETKEPSSKKLKTGSSSNDFSRDHCINKSNKLKNSVLDLIENTAVDSDAKNTDIDKVQKNPVTENVNKVQNLKESEACGRKIECIPSSIVSADMFESNDPYIQSCIKTPPKHENKIVNDISSVSTYASPSPNKDGNKSNLESNVSDVTMVDLMQFGKEKSYISQTSDGSNKENSLCNKELSKNDDVLEDPRGENKSLKNEETNARKESVASHCESYDMRDSLIDITKEQMALQEIENELLGNGLIDQNVEINKDNNFTTPTRKSKYDYSEDDFDSDNIDATPVAKRRQTFNISIPKSINESLISHERQLNVIAAITPVKHRKTYPLCHSTPLVESKNLENVHKNRTKKIVLICSGLQAKNIKTVQDFAKKFNAKFENNFTMDVTHVIVQTDSATKVGQKTFKYVQGIAYKKFVISFQWILDCLQQETLLDEENEKYDVLDPYNFECGAKISRSRTRNIFEGFAFFCLEPFSSFVLDEFKNLLNFNGAIVARTLNELVQESNKFRIILIESETISPKILSILKRSKSAIVSFEWIVDCISQYQMLPLSSYFYETTTAEALAIGLPEALLIEEDEESE